MINTTVLPSVLPNQTPLVESKSKSAFEHITVKTTWKNSLNNTFQKIYRFAVAFFGIIGNILILPFQWGKKGLKEYCFTQQFNDSCHLSPLQNLKILEKIKEANYDLSKVPFSTRREWLGENQDMLQSWHRAINTLTCESGKQKYPAMYNYLMGSQTKAPIFPHFYNEKGKRPFKGLNGLMEFGELPFFLVDIKSIQDVSFRVLCTDVEFGEFIAEEDLGLKTGFVSEKGIIKLYNKETKTYDSIENLEWVLVNTHDKDLVITIDEDKLPENARKTYALPDPGHKVTMRNIKGLGFSKLGVDSEMGGGIKIANEKGEENPYIIFQMSLLKMLFLALGLDSNNESITEEHHLYPAFKEFQEIMSADETNLWSKQNLSKEIVIQYHLANIFKSDPDIKREAIATVDALIGNWKNYSKLNTGKFYDQQGKQMNEENFKDYILGNDQALAYFFMQNIRMAWYSSISPKVSIKVLDMGLPEFAGTAFHQHIKYKINKKTSVKLSNGKFKTTSFMKVWNQLLPLVKKEMGDRKDLISFDDHGWVMSFDEKIIEKQSKTKHIHDRGLLKQLGFAGIESWVGSELNLWYSKSRSR
jgi:hypothetical protein